MNDGTPFGPTSRRRLLRTASWLGVAAVAGRALPAAAQVPVLTGAELVKAAQKEGVISYYHNSDIDPTAKWSAVFSKKYGIEMKNMRLPSYPLYDRWINE